MIGTVLAPSRTAPDPIAALLARIARLEAQNQRLRRELAAAPAKAVQLPVLNASERALLQSLIAAAHADSDAAA